MTNWLCRSFTRVNYCSRIRKLEGVAELYFVNIQDKKFDIIRVAYCSRNTLKIHCCPVQLLIQSIKRCDQCDYSVRTLSEYFVAVVTLQSLHCRLLFVFTLEQSRLDTDANALCACYQSSSLQSYFN